MKLQWCARGLVAACLTLVAFAGAVGLAQAQPEPVPPPLPPAIDPLLPVDPGLYLDPNDEGGQRGVLGNFGRFCENWWVLCR
jgi:hypothetical protein